MEKLQKNVDLNEFSDKILETKSELKNLSNEVLSEGIDYPKDIQKLLDRVEKMYEKIKQEYKPTDRMGYYERNKENPEINTDILLLGNFLLEIKDMVDKKDFAKLLKSINKKLDNVQNLQDFNSFFKDLVGVTGYLKLIINDEMTIENYFSKI